MERPGEPPFGGPEFLDALARWVAEVRVDEAARARARSRWLRLQAAERTTFASVLTDLTERGRPVLVHSATGRRHRGVVAALGIDFVAVATDGALVLVATSAVTAVRSEPQGAVAASGRAVALELELVHALAGLAEERPHVAVATAAEVVSGTLEAVGVDVVTLRVEGDTRARLYVPVAAVLEVRAPAT